MGVLRFLELSRSLDGRDTGGRRYRLPEGGGPRVQLMSDRRESAGPYSVSSAGGSRMRALSPRWFL